jgi:DsbC/DsbD-like thiol-disulfide interchange protein
MTTLKQSISALALAAAVALPAQLAAQDQPIAPECTAQLDPASIEAGEKAVAVNVTVSEPVGPITGVRAPGESGIALASPADLPRTEMAVEGAQPRPITMGEAENRWIVWLNVEEANPGTHALTFAGAEGTCTGSLNVGPGA